MVRDHPRIISPPVKGADSHNPLSSPLSSKRLLEDTKTPLPQDQAKEARDVLASVSGSRGPEGNHLKDSAVGLNLP